MFDLPTETKTDRYHYSRFRKNLEKQGFSMMQYSVYIRHCASHQNMQTYIKRIESLLPPKGSITMLWMTDKQFGEMKHFHGKDETKPPDSPQQLQFF
jgi:CRISPR-associated protein Cas2